MNQPPLANNSEEVLRGIVERVTYRNPENGYSVFRVSVSNAVEPITVVGNAREAIAGAHLILKGKFIVHPKFGRQFAASSVVETTPSTPEAIEKYLGSGAIKGIREKTAERLVKKFGEKTIDIILKDPEQVARLAGVGRKKAFAIHDALSKGAEKRETLRFLMEHNIPKGLSERIAEKYRNSTVEIVTKDPYRMSRDMRGVGFATADSIAMNLGLKADSPQRLRAGVYHALEKASEDGHCLLKETVLIQQARIILGLEDAVDLTDPIEELIRDDYLVRTGEYVALRHLYHAEEFVSQFVAKRANPWPSPAIPDQSVERSLSNAEKSLGIVFSQEQRDAVFAAAKYPLMIVTGGPGCGKTTIIKALSLLFREAGKKLYLAAPTGRAAQRMSQVCEIPASTIHRLLKFDPFGGGFLHGLNQQLPADAIIIDESSMIDILLARDLFSAIPNTATLILVGDRDQLPSVGPGRMLGDLVSLHEIKTISLSRLYRRASESNITGVAHLINSGTAPNIPEPDGQTKSDAYFIQRTDPEEAALLIEKLVSEQIPKKFGFAPNDIAVLTPTNRGPLGAINLNQRIQEKLNPSGKIDSEQEIKVYEQTFRIGDRVCQRSNNYKVDSIGVFNGDLGIIQSVDKRTRSLVVELWDGRLIKYEEGDLSQLSLAYAVTVHRSQGSEIPCVVLALHDSHYALLERQLIYTGVTRAKQLLVVVGSKRALNIASKRANSLNRCTRLPTRIRELLSK